MGAIVMIFFVGFLLAVITKDIVLGPDGVANNTISEILRERAHKSSFFPWLLAVYAGRWLNPFDGAQSIFPPTANSFIISIIMLVFVSGIVLLIDSHCRKKSLIRCLIIMPLGFVSGWLLIPIDFSV
jgi:hypothetical protein